MWIRLISDFVRCSMFKIKIKTKYFGDQYPWPFSGNSVRETPTHLALLVKALLDLQ
jgi:hypothetical protein